MSLTGHEPAEQKNRILHRVLDGQIEVAERAEGALKEMQRNYRIVCTVLIASLLLNVAGLMFTVVQLVTKDEKKPPSIRIEHDGELIEVPILEKSK